MRYYVLRISSYGADECDICKDWEAEVNPSGGFSFGEEDIEKGEKGDEDGKTHLFHSDCRCTLLPSPDGIPIKDGIDKKVLLSGALGHIYLKNKSSEERISLLRKHDDV